MRFLILLCLFTHFLVAEEETRELDAVQLETKAEKTDFKETGRYEEVARLCKAFVKAYPEKVKCHVFGKSPEGRDLYSLIISGDGTFDAHTAKSKDHPVLFFQGGIHAGEIDGKDAGFLYLKELLRGEVPNSPLKQAVLIFVPVFNVDGHERFGKNHRPNQVGPSEMGWRTTSENLNLNRDYMKAESPEMRAMIAYLNEWDPILYVDLHVTDGADFQPEIAIMIHPALKGEDPLHTQAKTLSTEVQKKMKAKGHLALDFYPSFIKEDNPASGFEMGVAAPRFSQSYWGERNRIGVLVETHSWKDYFTRVKAIRDAIEILAEETAKNGKAWLKAALDLDEKAKKSGGSEVILTYKPSQKSKTIDFPGVKYEREKSPICGRPVSKYFPKENQIWKVPFFDELVPKLTVYAPKGGYVIPATMRELVEKKLKTHGIDFKVLEHPLKGQTVEKFVADSFEFGKVSFEGRQSLNVKGKWDLSRADFTAGMLFVPIAQAKSKLVLHLFEPEAPDSLVTWGYFNAYFEKKEYLEPYVNDLIAREMLEKNPALKSEFEQKLKDPEFEKDPEKRFDFFYRKHPMWDSNYGVYPVWKTSTVLIK